MSQFPAIEEAKAILNSPTSWIPVDSDFHPYRYDLFPTEEAKGRFNLLPLTVKDLKSLKYVNSGGVLVFGHPSWSEEDLFQLAKQDIFSVPAIIRARDILHLFKRIHGKTGNIRYDHFYSGERLSPETLDWAMRNGFYTVAVNPNTPTEAIEAFILSKNPNDPNDWWESFKVAEYLIRNPNATPELLAWVGVMLEPNRILQEAQALGYHPGTLGETLSWAFRNKNEQLLTLASNPNTPTSTLSVIPLLTKQRDVKLALAKHENTERSILRKLATSADNEIQVAAAAHLNLLIVNIL